MNLPVVYELSMIGVEDAGVPNRERIILRPTQPINLAQFGIIIATKGTNELLTPLLDHFFWFGEFTAYPPSWLVVYTGPGEFLQTRYPIGNEIAYSLHWGKPTTAFSEPNIVPVLVRIGAILSGIQLLPAIPSQLQR
jgi:hypothetical protein